MHLWKDFVFLVLTEPSLSRILPAAPRVGNHSLPPVPQGFSPSSHGGLSSFLLPILGAAGSFPFPSPWEQHQAPQWISCSKNPGFSPGKGSPPWHSPG